MGNARTPTLDLHRRMVRIRLFEYRFSSWDELREEGRWWSREERGIWARYER